MTPKFFFEMTREAAATSFLILKNYGFKLEKATNTQKLSPLGYGCEFRPPKTLQRIFTPPNVDTNGAITYQWVQMAT
jgi:hypothetical protein